MWIESHQTSGLPTRWSGLGIVGNGATGVTSSVDGRLCGVLHELVDIGDSQSELRATFPDDIDWTSGAIVPVHPANR